MKHPPQSPFSKGEFYTQIWIKELKIQPKHTHYEIRRADWKHPSDQTGTYS